MMWYGPSGIGTARGIKGFRDWHQIPFLNAMPDRGKYVGAINYHFFGDRAYAAVTGWPNMYQTITQGGWLGLPPTNNKIRDAQPRFLAVGGRSDTGKLGDGGFAAYV